MIRLTCTQSALCVPCGSTPTPSWLVTRWIVSQTSYSESLGFLCWFWSPSGYVTLTLPNQGRVSPSFSVHLCVLWCFFVAVSNFRCSFKPTFWEHSWSSEQAPWQVTSLPFLLTLGEFTKRVYLSISGVFSYFVLWPGTQVQVTHAESTYESGPWLIVLRENIQLQPPNPNASEPSSLWVSKLISPILSFLLLLNIFLGLSLIGVVAVLIPDYGKREIRRKS